MATLSEIKNAGLNVSPSSGMEEILSAITQVVGGGLGGYQQGQQAGMDKLAKAQDYYNKKREAGWDAYTAAKDTNRLFGTNIGTPTNDPYAMKQAQEGLETQKIQQDLLSSESKRKEETRKGRWETRKTISDIGLQKAEARRGSAVGRREMTPSEAYEIINFPRKFKPDEVEGARKVVRKYLGLESTTSQQTQVENLNGIQSNQPTPQPIAQERTAVNPKTGEKIVWRNGKWQKMTQ